MDQITAKELILMAKKSKIISIWLDEIKDGESYFYSLRIVHLEEMETINSFIYGQQGEKRIWRSVDRCLDFLDKYAPEFTTINIKKLDRFGD